MSVNKEVKRITTHTLQKMKHDGEKISMLTAYDYSMARVIDDAGMEVIYTGLRQTPEMVVNTALQEDVDAIGVSILSGAHNTIFPKILQLLKEKEMDDVLLTGGGIIPDADMKSLNEAGVGKLFPPGTPTGEIATYIKNWVKENRSF